MLDDLRHGAALASLIRAEGRAALLRAGLRSGLFEALRTPQSPEALAASHGLERELCAAWLRALEAHGLVVRRGDTFRLGGFVRWLLLGPDADACAAALDQSAYAYVPVLSHLPELMQGAPLPEWGGREEALRTARASRLSERRALAALDKIPDAKLARRILDIGCGEAHTLARLLARYRDALGTGLELDASVAERAEGVLAAAHVQRRAEIRVESFLSAELPNGFDLALLNNNLHYFAEADWPALFARVFAHLAPGGLFAIQTPVLDGGALSRALGIHATLASFDVFLRAHTNLAGLPDAAALDAALRGAGFAEIGAVPILPGGALRYVWARKPAAAAAVANGAPVRA